MKKGGGGARHYLAFFTYLVGLPIEWTLCLIFLVFLVQVLLISQGILPRSCGRGLEILSHGR